MNDHELLRRYLNDGSQGDFAQLVERHVNLVYSAAKRLVRDPHLAEDITQQTFVLLARKAGQMGSDTIVSAWLYRTARYLASETQRREGRRLRREQLAVETMTLSAPESGWQQIAPLLDEAMANLNSTDHDAVVLRYFENKSLKEVGEVLGFSENAAQKRVSRAVERLREFFAKRGVTAGASGLVVVISANAVQAAPVGLAVTVSTAAALAGTTIATAATATATKAIAMTTLQKTIITAALAAAVGTGIYEARQASTLRSQVQTLQQQQAPLTDQIQQLRQERDAATQQVASLREDNSPLNRNPGELLKLRGEVARLRGDSKELAQLKAADLENAKDPEKLAIRDWLARAADLAQRIEKMPETKIPEFRFLRPVDWLEIAKDASLETDTDVRNAAQMLGGLAKNAFARLMRDALNKFLEVHNGELPTEITQLKSFFPIPVEDEVLQRYELLHSGNLEDVPGLDKSYRLVAEKRFAPVGSGRPLVQIGTNGFNRTGQ